MGCCWVVWLLHPITPKSALLLKVTLLENDDTSGILLVLPQAPVVSRVHHQDHGPAGTA